MSDQYRRWEEERTARDLRRQRGDDDWREPGRTDWRPENDDRDVRVGRYAENRARTYGPGPRDRGNWRSDEERRYRALGPSFPDTDEAYNRAYAAGYGVDRDHRGDRYYETRRDYQRDYDNERGFFEKASDEVASWFGDADAERRREADQHRGHGPKGYTRSADRIREDVCDRLADDVLVDAREIDITVNNGEVTLSGTVPSRNQRRRAEAIAESVSGVVHVQNNTRVAFDGPVTAANTPATDLTKKPTASGRR